MFRQFLICAFLSLTSAYSQLLDTTFNPVCGGATYATIVSAESSENYLVQGLVETDDAGEFVRNKHLTRLSNTGEIIATFENGLPLRTYFNAATDPTKTWIFAATEESGTLTSSIRRISFVDGSVAEDGFVAPVFSGESENGRPFLFLQVLNEAVIMVTGGFNDVNGSLRDEIALISPSGELLPGFAELSALTSTGESASFFSSVDADRSIVLSGDFTSINGSSRPGWARFNSEGTLLDDLKNLSEPIDRATRLRNGSHIITGEFDAIDGVARNGWALVSNTGDLDVEFAPDLELQSSGQTYFYELESEEFFLIGSFIIPGERGDLEGNSSITERFLSRIDRFGKEMDINDRMADARFSFRDEEGAIFTETFISGETIITKLTASGERDSEYQDVRLGKQGQGSSTSLEAIMPLEDGRQIFRGRFGAVNGDAGYDGYALVGGRGDVDTRFKLSVRSGEFDPSLFSEQIKEVPGQKLLVIGNYDTIDGSPVSPKGIARINLPPPIASYAEFVAARLPGDIDSSPNGDADGDGIPNLVEYATGEAAEPVVITPRADGDIRVSIVDRSRSDVTLSLEASPDGVMWEVVVPPVVASGPATFYRLRAVLAEGE